MADMGEGLSSLYRRDAAEYRQEPARLETS